MREPIQSREKRAVGKRAIKSNTWAGFIFLIVGLVLLMRQFGYDFPEWLFSWQMIVIVVGLFIGVRNNFRDFSWLILIAVGFIFLADDIWPGFPLKKYAIPGCVILVGLIFLFTPAGLCKRRQKQAFVPGLDDKDPSPPDIDMPGNIADTGDSNVVVLDVVSVFAGIKKRVLSKNFKGGEIVCIFGGCELNLMNADFTGPIEIDVVQIFGGTKLIVPGNWEIRSEVAAIFGGLDDKRPHPGNTPPEKIVILKGTTIFGGIDISSF